MTAWRAATIVVLFASARPASAQYRAQIVVTGGAHAGTYELTPPTCMFGPAANGPYVITMNDERVSTARDRVASLTVAFGSVEKAALGTTDFRFAIGFGGDGPAQPAAIQYSGMESPQPPGAASFTFNFVYREETFRASFSAATIDGTDSVRVSATIGCKGVNRRPGGPPS